MVEARPCDLLPCSLRDRQEAEGDRSHLPCLPLWLSSFHHPPDFTSFSSIFKLPLEWDCWYPQRPAGAGTREHPFMRGHLPGAHLQVDDLPSRSLSQAISAQVAEGLCLPCIPLALISCLHWTMASSYLDLLWVPFSFCAALNHALHCLPSCIPTLTPGQCEG